MQLIKFRDSSKLPIQNFTEATPLEKEVSKCDLPTLYMQIEINFDD